MFAYDGVTPSLIPDDVFSASSYTGTGAARSTVNDINLSTHGGMVWIKGRSAATDHAIYDTVRGTTKDLVTNSSAAETTQAQGVTAFNSNGFSTGTLAKLNTSAATYISWTFRQASGFFDVVSYTGTGANTTIAHDLDVAPEFMIIKQTNTTNDWLVYHKDLTSAAYILRLNLTSAETSIPTVFNSTDPTDSVFSLGAHGLGNTSGGSYIAYLFGSYPGVSKVGSYTGTGAALNIDCGFPTGARFVLIKQVSFTGPWRCFDTTRGIVAANDSQLLAETAGAETTTSDQIDPYSTGFALTSSTLVNDSGERYVYLAIA